MFELGSESITVKHEKEHQARCVAFQIVPNWERYNGNCRLGLYDDQGPIFDKGDGDIGGISELALKFLR